MTAFAAALYAAAGYGTSRRGPLASIGVIVRVWRLRRRACAHVCARRARVTRTRSLCLSGTGTPSCHTHTPHHVPSCNLVPHTLRASLLAPTGARREARGAANAGAGGGAGEVSYDDGWEIGCEAGCDDGGDAEERETEWARASACVRACVRAWLRACVRTRFGARVGTRGGVRASERARAALSECACVGRGRGRGPASWRR